MNRVESPVFSHLSDLLISVSIIVIMMFTNLSNSKNTCYLRENPVLIFILNDLCQLPSTHKVELKWIGAVIQNHVLYLFRSRQLYRCDVKEYDKMFALPLNILKYTGVRLSREDSPCFSRFWYVYFWMEFSGLCVAAALELMQIAQTAQGGSFEDAVLIFKMMPCVGYVIMALTRSWKFVSQRCIHENLLKELRQMWPQEDITQEEYDIISATSKELNIFMKGYYWCNHALLLFYMTAPLIEIIKRLLGQDVPLILPFFYWFPFDPYERIYYPFVLVLQTWQGIMVVWFVLCGDLLFSTYVSYITMQFGLLTVRIRNLMPVPVDQQLIEEYPLALVIQQTKRGEDGNDRYSNRSSEPELHEELRGIIIRHRDLIRLGGDVESLFSFSLLVNFCNSSVILCFCGFCCVVVEKWNEISYKLFLATAMVQTWLLCWYGEKLKNSSIEVSNSLYNCGWYHTSQKIRKLLLIMIHRSQKEVHVTTYGFSVISLKSYTAIIRTAWSYFMLLLKIYDR